MVNEISPPQLAELLKSDTPPIMLDVREPWEYALCKIDQSLNTPMNTILGEAPNLDQSKHYIAICHHGMRSLQVANFLSAQGFNIDNLTGGIDLWAQTVEPEMARY